MKRPVAGSEIYNVDGKMIGIAKRVDQTCESIYLYTKPDGTTDSFIWKLKPHNKRIDWSKTKHTESK